MSVSRHCSIYKDVKGDWYLELADSEYGERGEANLYGPFKTDDEAVNYLDNFSNPGGFISYEGAKTPTKAPNGSAIISP